MSLLFEYSGLLACVWIVIGIVIASSFYPNYNHSKQFCSELGAINSPTQKLSPLINNYPLGLLFCMFGVWLIFHFPNQVSSWFIGLMLLAHGVGTWVAGFFPMDEDPYTKNPSVSLKIHSRAAMVMFLSLLIAPAIVVFNSHYPSELRVFSAICIVSSCFFSYKLAAAYKDKTNPGLHQRLSYGFQLVWLIMFSLFVTT